MSSANLTVVKRTGDTSEDSRFHFNDISMLVLRPGERKRSCEMLPNTQNNKSPILYSMLSSELCIGWKRTANERTPKRDDSNRKISQVPLNIQKAPGYLL